jgi:hypothetical protein
VASIPSIGAAQGLRHSLAKGPTLRTLLAAIALYLCGGHVLLAVFVGYAGPVPGATAAILIVLLMAGLFLRPWTSAEPRIGWRTLLCCWGAVGLLLILSGEGRLFYANVDWQVRQALLGDMGRSPWPFLYDDGDRHWLLRAPLGMYFVPALAWQWAGERAAGITMLVQNTLLIGTLLAAVSPALPNRRARLIGLIVFVAFSGLDAVGSLANMPSHWDHIESWAGLQYSSTVTLLFWVPHHAIAGWVGAAAYLLWRSGLAPARLLLAMTPLVSLWSPLAMIGLLPFAAHAGIDLVLSRRLRWADVLVPALAVLLTIPALVYLAADPGGAPFRVVPTPLRHWVPFLVLEVLVFLIPLGLTTWKNPSPKPKTVGALIAVALTLFLLPFTQIGESADLMMRGSIPALAVLTFLIVEELTAQNSSYRAWLIAALIIGAITPAMELTRALRHPAAPRVDCTMFEAWDIGPKLYGARILSKGTYLAQVEDVPQAIRPARPGIVPAYSGKLCWNGYWYSPLAQ